MVQIPRLREWREARALTQVELAERAGVSSRSVAGYEAGAGARPPTVRRLAEALDVEIADLVSPPGKEEAPPSRQRSFENHLDLEEERRDSYLGVALEEIRAKADAARWALEDVSSFTEAEGDIKRKQKLESWGHFIGELRDDVHHKARRWRDVFTESSGHEMPAWERARADEIRYQLERYEELVKKLLLKVNDEWERFQQRHGERHGVLVAREPHSHPFRLRPLPEEDAMPAADDELTGIRPIEEAGEAS